MAKTVSIMLTAAVAIAGEIQPAKTVLHDVDEKLAKNLLARGRAVLAEPDDDASEELQGMTVAQLREIADEAEIDGASTMKKAELIKAIEALEAAE